MEQLISYKYRLYPTNSQEKTLNQFFGAKRWVFNTFLAKSKEAYAMGEKFLSNFDINNEITKLKKLPDTEWLKEIDDWALKHASEDLSVAYKNFFDSIKGKRAGTPVEVPKFKSKSNKQSYRTRNVKVDFDKGMVFLPKIKYVKCEMHRKLVGTIKTATISKTPSGKYFISILVLTDIQLKPMTGEEVGCDLGLKDLLILSTGVKFDHPEKMLSKAKKALKKQQRILAGKTKGSKNRNKQRIKVSKCYEKVTNIRNNYYHLISRYLVDNFDAIYLENLNVSGMMKNHKLARKIAESAWSTLVSMIKYKAAHGGKTLYQIGRFELSSKTCSCCGHKLDKLSLSVRNWACPSCGSEHDRDLNAAINIKHIGQTDLYDHVIPSVATTEVEEIPMALKKHSNKIEKSGCMSSLNGEQANLTIKDR